MLAAAVCAAVAVWAGGERPPPRLASPTAHPPTHSPDAHPPAPPVARPDVPLAPYVSAWAAGYDMAEAAARGVKEFTLGVGIAGGGCVPVWDGGIPLADRALT